VRKTSWIEETWVNNTKTQYKLGLELIEKLQPKDGEVILDLGCGDGRLTLEIAKNIPNGRVIGIDISDALLAMANKNLDESRLSNVTFMNMNAMEMNSQEEYDAIYSNMVLDLIPNQDEFYGRLHAALKPGGRLLVNALINPPNGPLVTLDMKALMMLAQQPKYKALASAKPSASFNSVPPDTTKQMAEGCGFADVNIETKDEVQQFADVADAAACGSTWRGVFSILKAIPDQMRKMIVDDMETGFNQLLEQVPEEELAETLQTTFPIFTLQAIRLSE
jgi:ubiquinone/menaquinone biosynthesis C-methylase UbiE